MSAERTTVCLNMIVKNEAPVIERCLRSVEPLIDHWVIVDTGSSDGTQDIITKTLANIPGRLHERPWVNFGHNRTEAIKLATKEADYILTLDADEIIECEASFNFGALTADAYNVFKRRGNREYRVPNLVRAACNWRWVGVLHEQPESDKAKNFANIDNIIIASPREGTRARDPHTYKRDALMLEQEMIDRPSNSRTVFYLAQSYRDADDFDLAIRYYRRRIKMDGWHEEIFVSLHQIAYSMMCRGDPWPKCLEAYLAAYAHTPERIEPLFEIGMEYARQKNWPLAFMFLEQAAEGYRNDDSLFVEADVYDWRAKLEAAVAAYWMGRHDRAIALNDALLNGEYLPAAQRPLVERNKALSIDAMRGQN